MFCGQKRSKGKKFLACFAAFCGITFFANFIWVLKKRKIDVQSKKIELW
jgi:hypothetical protein